MKSKDKFLKIAIFLITCLIFYTAIIQRLMMFSQQGNDYEVYIDAIDDFNNERNLYLDTIESYKIEEEDPQNTGDHGYAYFPGILYSILLANNLTNYFDLKDYEAWKFPVLLADIGIGVLIILVMKLKNFRYFIPALLFWYFNPYFTDTNNYENFDPLPIFFMLLALYYTTKSDIKSGIAFSIAVLLKTFPIILLPLLFVRSKNKLKFSISASVTFLIASMPFLQTINDFITYIRGTLFVHEDRKIQGRPFLFFFSYYAKVEFFRIIPLKVYANLAMFGALVTSGVSGFFTKVNSNILALGSFAVFYLFTPVLNKTYLLWCMPLFSIAMYYLFKDKKHAYVKYLVALVAFWSFYKWYLVLWTAGFDTWRPPGVYFDH